MTQIEFTPSTDLYRTIISAVAEDYNSPYKQLMRKTNDIDVDYFEHIRRDTEIMEEELNLELKDRVLNDFKKMADELFIASGLAKGIVDKTQECVFDVKNGLGENACKDYLGSLARELKNYAHGLSVGNIPPKHSLAEIEELYQSAKQITWKERILINNKADIIKFYHALMDRTWWECRVFVENYTRDFLLYIADEICNVDAMNEVPFDGYIPLPEDTSNVILSEDLSTLVEAMAKNVHEVWAKERIVQGWRFGNERDDKRKLHPCLIPYEELPEEEKVYDRNTSIETLKFILKQGFVITKRVSKQ